MTARSRLAWPGQQRRPGRVALLFVVTLSSYWLIWLTRVYAGLRERPGATRVSPEVAAVLLLVPLVNVAFAVFLALDLPRAVRRAQGGRVAVETEPLTLLLLAAPFAAIALAIALGLSPLIVGYLAWPLELPALLAVQRALNRLPADRATSPRALDGETAASAVLALAIAVVIAVALIDNGGGESATPEPPAQFSDIAASRHGLWITRLDNNTLERLDPGSGRPVGKPIRVGRSPLDVTSGYGSIWVANYRSDSVSRIDSATGRRQAQIAVGRGPFGIAAGFGAIWVTNQVDRSIVRIDPRTNSASRAIPIGGGPRGIDVGEGAVYAAAAGARGVFKLDPRSRETTEITVGRLCQDVAVAAGRVWVATPQENQVMRIDPARRRIVGKPIQVGLSPSSIDYGAGILWVANSAEGTVSRIDPRRARVVGKPIRIGKQVSDLTVRGRNVWVLRTDGRVKRVAP